MNAIMEMQVAPRCANTLRPESDWLGVEPMDDRTCSIDGCQKGWVARGLCRAHYAQARNAGQLLSTGRRGRPKPEGAEAVMRAANLEPIAPYPGANVRWPCLCIQCGSEVAPRYSGIKGGQGGCRDCGYRDRDQRAERHPSWVGDRPTYKTLHARLLYARGRASDQTCADCSSSADDWSYDWSENESPLIDEDGRRYSADLSAYSARCKSCHRKYDADLKKD